MAERTHLFWVVRKDSIIRVHKKERVPLDSKKFLIFDIASVLVPLVDMLESTLVDDSQLIE